MNKTIIIGIFAMVLLVGIPSSIACEVDSDCLTEDFTNCNFYGSNKCYCTNDIPGKCVKLCAKHSDCVGYHDGNQNGQNCYGCVTENSWLYSISNNKEFRVSAGVDSKKCSLVAPFEGMDYCKLYGDNDFISIECISDSDCQSGKKCYTLEGWCVECSNDQDCINKNFGQNWWICDGEEKGQGHCVDNRIDDISPLTSSCGDMQDNDGDSLIDKEDPDCYEQCTWSDFLQAWDCKYNSEYIEDNVKDTIYSKCNFNHPSCTAEDCLQGRNCEMYYNLFTDKFCETYCFSKETLPPTEPPTQPPEPTQPPITPGVQEIGEVNADNAGETNFNTRNCYDMFGNNNVINSFAVTIPPVCQNSTKKYLFARCNDNTGGCEPLYNVNYCNTDKESLLSYYGLPLDTEIAGETAIAESCPLSTVDDNLGKIIKGWVNEGTDGTVLSAASDVTDYYIKLSFNYYPEGKENGETIKRTATKKANTIFEKISSDTKSESIIDTLIQKNYLYALEGDYVYTNMDNRKISFKLYKDAGKWKILELIPGSAIENIVDGNTFKIEKVSSYSRQDTVPLRTRISPFCNFWADLWHIEAEVNYQSRRSCTYNQCLENAESLLSSLGF